MSEQLYRWAIADQEPPPERGYYNIVGISNSGKPTPPHKIWFSGKDWMVREGCKVVWWEKSEPLPLNADVEQAAKEYAEKKFSAFEAEMDTIHDRETSVAAFIAGAGFYKDGIDVAQEMINEYKAEIEKLKSFRPSIDIVKELSNCNPYKEYTDGTKTGNEGDWLKYNCSLTWIQCVAQLSQFLNQNK